MKLKYALLALATAALLVPSISYAAEIGRPAPDFTATDTNGKTVTLAQLKGHPVVLEWTNHQCPFVVKHYGSGNMQALQKEAAADGVTWISIVSSAEGKEGYTSAEEANKIVANQKAFPTHKILDSKGEIGHLYGAKTTPHMFVVDKDGMLAYAGAIDDNDSFDPATVKDAKNYVRAALQNLKEGKGVETASTNPYGCGVKY